jgi:sugar phosphate isomerase/epimerase
LWIDWLAEIGQKGSRGFVTLPDMHRRTFLTATLLASARSLLAASGTGPARLGICAFSCHQRWKLKEPVDAAAFFRYARELGADGVQGSLRGADPKGLRDLVEGSGGYYEGEVRLPKTESDLSAFEAEARQCREAGATVARAIFTGGRRYEIFQTVEAFAAFHEQAKQSLALAEPILAKLRLKLAVENHKDLTAAELAGLMRAIDSEWIGVLYDTGNNLALLEDPAETLAALAPFALGVHLKDMTLQPDADGFLLSETPLGAGFLDLKGIVATLRKANPDIVLNLEMATRDPLRIPCLTDAYFATFPDRRGTHLEAALARVKAHPPKQAPPSVSGKEPDRILAEEEANNRHGLAWMDSHLGV